MCRQSASNTRSTGNKEEELSSRPPDNHDGVGSHRTKSKKFHPPTYLRIGKLRFGFHGLWAILCLTFTTASLYSSNSANVWATILSNFILARDAGNLMDQVPQSTTIFHNTWFKVIAPHREAFQRTMAVMQHINLRLAEQQLAMTQWVLPFPVYALLLVWSWYQFNPLHSDFTNGNTWFFVVPMFLGVTVDCVMQCQGGLVANYLTTQYLLGVQLSSLFIAFAFTLAFRGIIRIGPIYFGSAAIVAALFVGVLSYLAVSHM